MSIMRIYVFYPIIPIREVRKFVNAIVKYQCGASFIADIFSIKNRKNAFPRSYEGSLLIAHDIGRLRNFH